MGMRTIGVLLDFGEGLLHSVAFSVKNAKEDSSDNCKKASSKGPTQDESEDAFTMRIVDVFPNDFLGFWSLIDLDIFASFAKIMIEHLRVNFLELLNEFIFDLFSFHDKYDLLADNLILGDKF
jgi:hypothetical protein